MFIISKENEERNQKTYNFLAFKYYKLLQYAHHTFNQQ